MKISVIRAFEIWPYLSCMFMPGVEDKVQSLHNPALDGIVKDTLNALRNQAELIMDSQPAQNVDIRVETFLVMTHLNGAVEKHFKETTIQSVRDKNTMILNQTSMFVKVLTTMEKHNPQIREAEDDGLMEIFRNMQKGNDQ